MDDLDNRILNELQNKFPLAERPYEVLAEQLGISEQMLWQRVEKMVANGRIRRLGASLSSHELGFYSTLAAVSVKASLIEKASEVIAEFTEVTHSYLRKDDFNIWFTIIACDQKRIAEILNEIQTHLSLNSSKIINLPMKKQFKLDARFNATTQ
ncbi:Lrp/AsnC family transcriptional regulator [Planctomycetota bacterium]